MAIIGDKLLLPEDGWNRYDDTDELISYIGDNWSILTSFNTFYNSTLHQCQILDMNAKIKFKFSGTKLRILNAISPSKKNLNISIDGVSENFSCNKNSSSFYPHLVYEKTGLKDETHNVIITLIDGEYMSIDAIDVEGYLLPELVKDYEFPVKTIEKSDIEAYAESCINGEEQLLIAIEDGSQYLTKGNGSYIECGISIEKYNELEQRIINLEKLLTP